ncbi:MAG: alcohol dehydrogenase catalytic domain-containing protein [Burkholderiales bacterium]|nr:alcohol dehydrogenase catalytic domain-containing protein [Burkholderiales bacterium]
MLSYQVEAFGRPLARVLRDTPQPQGTEVLLQVGSCGVCHSDLHLQDGYFDLGGGNRIDMTRPMSPPRTLGHEIAGTVVALGPEAATLGVQVGDRRIVYPWIGCGRCGTCAAGNEHLCGTPQALGSNRDGGFASHVVVPHPRVLLEFEPQAEEQACTLACSGLTAYSALKKLGAPAAGDAVLIIGAGGLGLSAIRLARRMLGAAPIVAEVDKSKWDVAREAGASEVIDPTADGAARALVKATGGGVAAAVDFVGAASTFGFGFGALRKGGKLVCVGLFGGSAAVLPTIVSMKALTIAGSYVGSLQELRELIAIAREGRLPALPLTSRPLAEASQALDDLRAGRVKGRAILKP